MILLTSTLYLAVANTSIKKYKDYNKEASPIEKKVLTFTSQLHLFSALFLLFSDKYYTLLILISVILITFTPECLDHKKTDKIYDLCNKNCWNYAFSLWILITLYILSILFFIIWAIFS